MPDHRCESCCTTQNRVPTAHLIGCLSLYPPISQTNNNIKTSFPPENGRGKKFQKQSIFFYLKATAEAKTLLDSFYSPGKHLHPVKRLFTGGEKRKKRHVCSFSLLETQFQAKNRPLLMFSCLYMLLNLFDHLYTTCCPSRKEK